MPLQQLLHQNVSMSFCKRDNQSNEIFIDDVMQVQKPGYATIFHALLQLETNEHLMILNNTIVGRAPEEILTLIEELQVNVERNEFFEDVGIPRQLILVDHTNNGLKEHLVPAIYENLHVIDCTMNEIDEKLSIEATLYEGNNEDGSESD